MTPANDNKPVSDVVPLEAFLIALQNAEARESDFRLEVLQGGKR
jgi:hypothetical protein